MSKTAIVSVSNSFEQGMTMDDLRWCASGNWAITSGKCEDVSVLLAVFEGQIIGAFDVTDHARVEETYRKSNGTEAPRIGFFLGAVKPLTKEIVSLADAALNEKTGSYNLRRGIAVV